MLSKAKTIEWLLTMVIIGFFVVSIGQLIYLSSTTYAKQISEEKSLKQVMIASGYIDMKVKQNDGDQTVIYLADCVQGYPGIKITHTGLEEGYFTYIFYANGQLLECYTDELTQPNIDFSEAITKVQQLSFYQNELGMISVDMAYTYDDQLQMRTINLARRSR